MNDVATYLHDDFLVASEYMAFKSSECWMSWAMLDGSVMSEEATVFK